MRKSIISIVSFGLLGSGIFFVACKKKEDPAPTPVATTTTTGGSTTGSTPSTTTSGTTSGSTSTTSGTTSGSTSSTTTTSGTTSGSSSSGTTSGSTSSSMTTSGTTTSGTTTSTTTSGTTTSGNGTITFVANSSSTQWANNAIVGASANGALEVWFKTKPTVSGTYKIISYVTAASSAGAADEAGIVYLTPSSLQYWSSASTGGTLDVTVSGTVVTVSFNNKSLYNYTKASDVIVLTSTLSK